MSKPRKANLFATQDSDPFFSPVKSSSTKPPAGVWGTSSSSSGNKNISNGQPVANLMASPSSLNPLISLTSTNSSVSESGRIPNIGSFSSTLGPSSPNLVNPASSAPLTTSSHSLFFLDPPVRPLGANDEVSRGVPNLKSSWRTPADPAPLLRGAWSRSSNTSLSIRNSSSASTTSLAISDSDSIDIDSTMNDLEIAFKELKPTPSLSSHENFNYIPIHPAPAQSIPQCYPRTPQPILLDSYIYSKLNLDSLFFVFFYMPGSYQQFSAARELERRRWKFDKSRSTWTSGNTTSGRVFFDFENDWKIKPLAPNQIKKPSSGLAHASIAPKINSAPILPPSQTSPRQLTTAQSGKSVLR